MTLGDAVLMQRNVLKAAKELVLLGARNLGLYSAMKRGNWRRRQLLILAYHGISQCDEHKWRPALYMSPELFASRLETISQFGCNVLRLDEALIHLREGTLPPLSVVLTFDDGYFNFSQYAYPILKRFNYPATVYQTTYYTEVQKPVFNLVRSYVLWKGTGKIIDAKAFLGRGGTLDLRTAKSVDAASLDIWKYSKSAGLGVEARQRLVENLADALGVDYREISRRRMFELMTKDELSQMAGEGVDFQLHTHRHRVPTSKDLFHKELEDNKRILEEIGQPKADHYAYPSGVFREELFPWLVEFGVRSATSCEPGLASRKSNSVCLPRFVDTSNISNLEFEAWLCGIRGLLPRREG
jgi:peptidoglycan/xylan/chitin deacetylase (PgdA/CDA1 family)